MVLTKEALDQHLSRSSELGSIQGHLVNVVCVQEDWNMFYCSSCSLSTPAKGYSNKRKPKGNILLGFELEASVPHAVAVRLEDPTGQVLCRRFGCMFLSRIKPLGLGFGHQLGLSLMSSSLEPWYHLLLTHGLRQTGSLDPWL